MARDISFEQAFCLLTGHEAFPWQRALYERLVAGNVPQRCLVPTALGKTAVMAVWLVALCERLKSPAPESALPRRLVFVVGSSTLVDHATDLAEDIRRRVAGQFEAPGEDAAALAEFRNVLSAAAVTRHDEPLAISTLRGRYADDQEWMLDPARPAIVIGSVDAIGSRLLFSGHRVPRKARSLYAGLLGQDSLVVHDEAHLEPAFHSLLRSIEEEQRRSGEPRRLRIMGLVPEQFEPQSTPDTLTLSAEDERHPVVQSRLAARRAINFCAIDREQKTAESAARLALAQKSSGQAVLVLLRNREDAEKVVQQLQKSLLPVEQLTAGLRGKERDELVERPLFRRFLRTERAARSTPLGGTVYLVCDGAGEVGTDLSADHLVCDLVPYDRMIQRFARANRLGNGSASIDIVVPTDFDEGDEYEYRRKRTRYLLKSLAKVEDGYDASPAALAALPADRKLQACTPAPRTVAATDILFDAWALTSVSPATPGVPTVVQWIHGVSDRDVSATYVAWREEVGELRGRQQTPDFLRAILENYPIKQHELIHDETDRVIAQLEILARREPDEWIWVVASDGTAEAARLGRLAGVDKNASGTVELAGATVVLSPSLGGLRNGLLDGEAEYSNQMAYDVADQWLDGKGRPRRSRARGDRITPRGMRRGWSFPAIVWNEVRRADRPPETDSIPWQSYVHPRVLDDDAASWAATGAQDLERHLEGAGQLAVRMADALMLSDSVREAVIGAAKHHDRGKSRDMWQRALANNAFPGRVLARSDRGRPPEHLSRYRHEFGSVLDLQSEEEFQRLSPKVQDLVLHLITAHHGRGRPSGPEIEAMDPAFPEDHFSRLAWEVPRRFARLQRQYGRWGLAYLESLVRAANILASETKAESW